MTSAPVECVFSDASVLINLAILHRFDLLAALDYRFLVPDAVNAEVVDPAQRAVLDEALARGWLSTVTLETPDELRLFAEMSSQLDPGESACLALAIARDGLVACDERRAFARIANEQLGPGRVFTTAGLLLAAIRAGAIDVEAADACKAILEQRRFRMRFASLRELLP